jgi:hypothetical protein
VDEECIAPLRSNLTIAIDDLTPRIMERRLREPEPAPLRWRTRSCAEELAKLVG